MKSQLLIPGKIKVGFNMRNDTYTGKLGYVIYHDGKTWRKETSWEGWRQKEGQKINVYENGKHETKTLGSEINPLEFDNVPTEGFVLNKKAGGYSSGWNHRSTYCRVYDPRGFEFEISIPNLLFILQETSSFKGKGLEGEFVYAWEGKDLVLLPASCEDYQKSAAFTKLQDGKVSTKDLVPGCSYKTKKQVDLTYLGRFNWYSMSYVNKKYEHQEIKTEKFHVFVDENYKKPEHAYYEPANGKYTIVSSLTQFASKNSDTPTPNYAELMEEFSKSKYASKPIELMEKPKEFTYDEEKDKQKYGHYLEGSYYIKDSEGEYTNYSICTEFKTVGRWGTADYKQVLNGFNLYKQNKVFFKDGKLIIKTLNYDERRSNKIYSTDEIKKLDFKDLYLKLDSGSKVKVEKY